MKFIAQTIERANSCSGDDYALSVKSQTNPRGTRWAAMVVDGIGEPITSETDWEVLLVAEADTMEDAIARLEAICAEKAA